MEWSSERAGFKTQSTQMVCNHACEYLLGELHHCDLHVCDAQFSDTHMCCFRLASVLDRARLELLHARL